MSAAETHSEPLVAVEDIHTYYGKSHILHGVSLNVGHGEVVGLLGRNGVGKSTTLKTIMGLVNPHQGRILLACRRTSWRGSASATCRRIAASSVFSP
jgi:branched-chain amino acid transport system ATP-binding protein